LIARRRRPVKGIRALNGIPAGLAVHDKSSRK
jgi:hypothetical protein